MPNFNGTGPRGRGPFTGRGMGYCVLPISTLPNPTPAPPDLFLKYYGRPRWGLRGLAGRRGRGFGRRLL